MSTPSKLRLPLWLGGCVFSAIALFFLWEEHPSHILGALPYVLLLMCPLMHLLMHRRHHHSRRHEQEGPSRHESAS
jgi:hypothetical protein